MKASLVSIRRALDWAHWLPAVRAGLWVVLLFVAAILITQNYAEPIENWLSAHATLSVWIFFVTTIIAVVLPMLSNLALVPAFVLAWGPWMTALVLLAGWVVGAALTFLLGRQARSSILKRFPTLERHAQIDRLIHPDHRIGSLVLLRMTFPVDLLSYALGVFSARTTLRENIVSTTIGAAPFALVFAFLPTFSGITQLSVFAVCLVLAIAYAKWVLNRAPGSDDVIT